MKRIVMVLIAAGLLAGCGVKGGLDRPPPMMGDAKARYEAEQAAKKKAEAEKDATRQRMEIEVAPAPKDAPSPQ